MHLLHQLGKQFTLGVPWNGGFNSLCWTVFAWPRPQGARGRVCDLTDGTVDLSGRWEKNLNLIVGKGLDHALVQVINTFEKAAVIRVMPHAFEGEVVAEF